MAPSKAENQLRKTISGEVRFDTVSRMLYRTDASIYEMEPEGVILPIHADDVVAAVKYAGEKGLAILPRGGGTSLAGQAVGSSIHLDFSKYMHGIVELNLSERWVRVQPGVVLDELNAHLRPQGLQFAPDVATSSRANIGGMIGNNSCGSRSIVYGKTIDHVKELLVVLSDGTLTTLQPLDKVEFEKKASRRDLEGHIYREVKRIAASNAGEIEARFPKVMRRVSGYNLDEFTATSGRFDLTKIVVGSEGTLCAVVEAKLNLEPLARHTALVACHFLDLIEALRANVIILETSPSAVELVDKILLDQTKGSIEYARHRGFIQGDPEALLFVEYSGDSPSELLDRMDHLEDLLRSNRLGYAYVKASEPGAQKQIWDLRKAGLGLLMGMKGDAKPNPGIEDSCVPPEYLPEYVAKVRQIVADAGAIAEYYGHASVGVLHIRPILNLKKPAGIKTLRLLEDRISDLVLAYGGSMSAEHGDGLARSEWIPKMFGAQIARAFEEVKRAFDPNGVMNPGKIVCAPRMDENLRYDTSYAVSEPDTHFDFTADGGLAGAAEMCSGIGQCRKKLIGTMCPSYMATLDEQHSTRGRANALRAALSGRLSPDGLASEELYQVMDLCLECKACKTECPSNVDMAKMKYEFLAHYHAEHGFPLRSRLFARIDRLGRLGVAFAPLSNWIAGSRMNRWLMEKIIGTARKRKLPAFARKRFSTWFAGREQGPLPGPQRGKVVLFVDTFTECFEPQIGMAATFLLERAGFEVILAEGGACCGRPLISKGFLAEAKENARKNIESLATYARAGLPIVGLEPSCLLAFRDDYLDLVDHPGAEEVASRCYLLEEFLVEADRAEKLDMRFTQTSKHILVHGHCHQKALATVNPTLSVTNMPPGFNAIEITAGCCGMAGSFGYEAEHYEVSLKVGEERLFSVIRDADEDVEIVAVGTSCRHQIRDATGREARHWVELLVEAL